MLAGVAALLLWAYNASVDSLIHLYVIGVFTAFTLSQAGMVRYWLRRKDPGWRRSAVLNAVGGTATGLVTLLVIQAKFTSGAWAVIVAIPLMIAGFYGVERHYRKVERRVRAGAAAVAAAPPATNQVVLYVESADAALREALWYARQIAGDDFRAVIAQSPGHFKAHLNLGRALWRTDDADAAERSYRRALALNPESAEALASLSKEERHGRMAALAKTPATVIAAE